MIDPEREVRRCPRLGGDVPLSYCLKENGGLPCRFILGCFRDLGDELLRVLRDNFSQEELKKAFSPPKDPYLRLLETIEKVK